ncbi:unnamed protein product [Aureobasidium mustum]|uniref:Oligosaccharyl transferase subunit n=1 Tax=Aureobasidium mustum TaxID=2773714 RepID=A0A9N8PGH0_9PEZI|nr:unnamed protein product [Aureobasidium mustum]
MKFFQTVTAFLLPLTALAAKKSSTDKFSDYRSQQLAAAAPLKLDDNEYSRLTAAPRDYSVAILLTALEARFGCAICHEFQPEWDLLGKTWAKGDKKQESRLVMGTLDFVNGQRTFQSLQLTTAPVLLYFPPTTGPDAKPDTQPLQPVHAWLARHVAGPTPPIVRPVNYVKIVTTTVAILGTITAFTVAAPYVLPIIQSRNLWAALSLIAVLLFTSGHMFNHIRKVPYVAGDGKGGISYFAGGFQNQFDAILAFATISLALKVPRMTDPRTQGIATLAWGLVMLAMYSYLLSTFRIKNGGYPFFLPPLLDGIPALSTML